ncbi:MAG: hypothetical protein H7X76_02055 [Prolixibacteraceae bacterium]|nr:hypothetical protein [Burkholderiales bacterium]
MYGPAGRRQNGAALLPTRASGVIASVWGHQAGNGLNAADAQFVDAEIKKLLAS